MEDNSMIDVSESIKNEIKSNDVVLFMKGTPVFPMCGFSAATVQVLSDIGGTTATDAANEATALAIALG